MKKYLSLLLCSAISLCGWAAPVRQQDQTAERLVGDNDRVSAREVSAADGRLAAETARKNVPTVRSRQQKTFAEMATSMFTLPTAPVAAASAPIPFNAEDVRKARCIIIGSDAWGDGEDFSGVYEFPLSGQYNFSLLGIQMDMWKISTYNEGVIYSTTYDYKAKTSTISQFDEESRELIKVVDLSSIIDVDAMCYDPISGNIYAYYYQSGAYYFGTINPETGVVNDIKGYGTYDYSSAPLWRAMIATPDGVIYSMTTDGTFQQVNKQTGELTVITKSAPKTYYLTSGMYDQQSGLIYYFTCPNGGGALYTINPADGASAKVYDVPYTEQVVCVYTPDAERDGKVPAAPAALNLNFADGTLEGSVSFTAPTTYYDGTEATGEFTATVSVDGEEVATKTAAFGAGEVTIPVTLASRGTYTFKLVLSNETGKSPSVVNSMYIGADDPTAVSSVNAKWANGKTTITWQPTEAAHGGYLDPASTVYKITRYVGSEGTVLISNCKETTFVDEFAEPEGKLSRIYYGVQAINGNYTSGSSYSSYITLGIIVPPFSDPIDDANAGAYKVIDANQDGVTWEYSKNAMRYDYARKVNADDYVILPKVKLTAGQMYAFSFDAACSDVKYPERVAAYIGRDLVLSAFDTELVAPTDITTTTPVTLTSDFVCPETGIYYFAIKACSDANKDELIVNNINVSAGSSANLPASVTDFTAAADPDGKLVVNISYKAPAVNLLGETLESIDKVEIYRGSNLIATQNPAPGAEMTYTDNEAGKGTQTYSVIAYNAEGAGKKAEIEVFVGFDIPAAVTNVKVTRGSNTGEVVLTWDPVTTDARGVALPAGSVTYAIASNINGETNVVKVGLTETTYTYQARGVDEDQQFVQFGLFAVTNEGSGQPTASSVIAIGKPYAMPWNESFANAKSTSIFATLIYYGNPHWELCDDKYLSDMTPADGDNGYANHYANGMYDSAALVTGMLDLTEGEHPTVSFYYFPLDGSGDDVNTYEVIVNDGNGFVNAIEPFKLFEAGVTRQWNKATIALDQFKGKIVQIGIKPTTYKYGNTFLDNVTVYNRADNDLAATISAPESVVAGAKATVTVTVENTGFNPSGEFTVDMLDGSEVVATTKCEALAATATTEVVFEVPTTIFTEPEITLTAVINYSADQKADNNSAVAKVAVEQPVHPVPTALDAQQDNNGVKLSWTAPDLSMAPTETILEDFESYESFAQHQAGDWKFLDFDGAGVGGWKNINIPGLPALTNDATFFIFDNSDSQFNKSYNTVSGTKFLAVIYNYNLEDNNDWAISPLLSGTEQTISLYARSYNKSYKERFTIMYSTTTDNPDDFEEVETVTKIPNEWGEYTFDLPAGSKYFAIRYKTPANEMLMIDDITYSPAGAAPIYVLAGYNIYRDGVKINDAPVATESFVDTNAPAGQHTYNVTALYTTKGESSPSNAAAIATSGIDAVGIDAAEATYYTVQGILVTNPEPDQLYIVVRNGKATKELYSK